MCSHAYMCLESIKLWSESLTSFFLQFRGKTNVIVWWHMRHKKKSHIKLCFLMLVCAPKCLREWNFDIVFFTTVAAAIFFLHWLLFWIVKKCARFQQSTTNPIKRHREPPAHIQFVNWTCDMTARPYDIEMSLNCMNCNYPPQHHTMSYGLEF